MIDMRVIVKKQEDSFSTYVCMLEQNADRRFAAVRIDDESKLDGLKDYMWENPLDPVQAKKVGLVVQLDALNDQAIADENIRCAVNTLKNGLKDLVLEAI